MKCNYCGINFNNSNSLRSFPLIWPLFLLGDVFTKHFCSRECEINYYNSKGKNPPSVITKFLTWILNIFIVISALIIALLILYAFTKK